MLVSSIITVEIFSRYSLNVTYIIRTYSMFQFLYKHFIYLKTNYCKNYNI